MKRNRFKTVINLSLLVVCFFSCSQSESDKNISLEEVDVKENFEAVKTIDTEPQKPKTETYELKIIKSANVRYKVEDVKKATEKIKTISSAYNAYISEMRFNNNLYRKENRFTIKVPSLYFDVIMDSINSVADFVEFENVTTKDVTSEYIDIEARLKTKIEVKERYETILRTKARSVEDLLDVEEKLRVIQEEIESSLGRLKYLTNKVSFSTLQVDLYETVEYTEEPGQYKKTFLSEIKDGFVTGWDILKTLFVGLVYIWPLLIIAVLVYIIIRRKIKNTKG